MYHKEPIQTKEEENIIKATEQLTFEKKDLTAYEKVAGKLDLSFKQLDEGNVENRIQIDFHPSSLILNRNEFTKIPCGWLTFNFGHLTSLSMVQNRLDEFPLELNLPQLRVEFIMIILSFCLGSL